jgi:hypothetical protein
MKTSATNRKIRVLLTDIRNGSLVPQPEFQRRLVWSNRHKRNFLTTVLEGLPFPEIYVAAGQVDPKTGEGKELLVDGQQRITTLNQYFLGSPDLKLADLTPYARLPEPKQVEFLEYEVVVRDLGPLDINTIREIFARINSTQYAVNAMELHNARYDGELKQYAEKLAAEPFFANHQVFTTAEARRMNDVLFALTVIVTLMSSYFNRDDDLDEFLARYNDSFPARTEIQKRMRAVFAFVDACDLTSKRPWLKADLLTLLVEVDRALHRDELKLKAAEVGKRLNSFYERVELAAAGATRVRRDVVEYYRAAVRSNTDRGRRITRGQVIADVIRGE